MDDENKIEVSPAAQAVDYAMNGDASNFKDTIDTMLYTKVADAISVKKHDIATSMFGDETIGDVADDQIDGEVEPEIDYSEPETEEESDEEL
jgi:hypothetical protein